MNIETSNRIAAAQTDWNALVAEWLAGLYLRPLTVETVRSFRDGPGAAFLDALAFQPECHSGATRMQSVLAVGDDLAEIEQRLSLAFTHLFDGVGGPRTASLYESAYSGTSSRLFQAATGDLDAVLRQSDASIAPSFKEPADHLSIELALLARLLRDGDIRGQSALLDLHLLAFAPLFAARCFEADRSGFYAGAADVLVGFLHARSTELLHGSAMSHLPVKINHYGIAHGAPGIGEAL